MEEENSGKKKKEPRSREGDDVGKHKKVIGGVLFLPKKTPILYSLEPAFDLHHIDLTVHS
jgi:hypothetical protein